MWGRRPWVQTSDTAPLALQLVAVLMPLSFGVMC
jgi:hypothetical protein